MNTFVTQLLGNTFKLVLTSSQLPWQQASSTKKTSKFQFLLISSKTKLVTYHFYCFVGKHPTFFNSFDNIDFALLQANVPYSFYFWFLRFYAAFKLPVFCGWVMHAHAQQKPLSSLLKT